jgi:hypothetical protein
LKIQLAGFHDSENLPTIASPLTEQGDEAVASETVDRCSVLEQRPVIPPSLVSTIELQVGLILEHLKLDPFTFWVAVTMVLSEEGLGLILLAIAVEPLWRMLSEMLCKGESEVCLLLGILVRRKLRRIQDLGTSSGAKRVGARRCCQLSEQFLCMHWMQQEHQRAYKYDQ